MLELKQWRAIFFLLLMKHRLICCQALAHISSKLFMHKFTDGLTKLSIATAVLKLIFYFVEKFVDLLNRNGHLQDSLKILRIYSSSVERKYNPDPYNKPLSSAKCPNWAEKFSLHYLLRNANDWKSIPTICELRELEEKIKKIKSEKKIPSGLIINKHRKLQNKAEIDFLKGRKFDIVFCTCNEAAGKRARYFSLRQCIIDESGMAHEPETIVPLRFCEHAILIGDHKQLQPVINYGPAKICGLSTSLFERYAMEYGEKYTYTLKTQYRMVRINKILLS